MTTRQWWYGVGAVAFVCLLLVAAPHIQRYFVVRNLQKNSAQTLREFTKDMQEVRFVRVDGDMLTFSWPEQVQRGGETFVEYVEHQALIRYRGVGRSTPPSIDYQDLEPGQVLRLDMEPHPTDPNLFTVNGAYIVD